MPEFDADLKGKHYKLILNIPELKDNVFEATGYFLVKADRVFLQIIRDYTIYEKPMFQFLLADNFEETDEPLTKLERMPTNKKLSSKKKAYDGREQPIQGPALGYHMMDTGDSDESGKTVNTEYEEDQEKKKKKKKKNNDEELLAGIGEGMSDRESLNNTKSLGYHIISPSREYQAENKELKGELIDKVLKEYIARKEDERPFKT